MVQPERPVVPTLTVAEVARESGVAPSAVRYYEQHGVIKAERTAGNQRRFQRLAVCQIQIALVAQRVGLTLREIAGHFNTLPEEPGPEDWNRFRAALIAEARNRLEALTAHLDRLEADDKLCRLGGTDQGQRKPRHEAAASAASVSAS